MSHSCAEVPLPKTASCGFWRRENWWWLPPETCFFFVQRCPPPKTRVFCLSKESLLNVTLLALSHLSRTDLISQSKRWHFPRTSYPVSPPPPSQLFRHFYFYFRDWSRCNKELIHGVELFWPRTELLLNWRKLEKKIDHRDRQTPKGKKILITHKETRVVKDGLKKINTDYKL